MVSSLPLQLLYRDPVVKLNPRTTESERSRIKKDGVENLKWAVSKIAKRQNWSENEVKNRMNGRMDEIRRSFHIIGNLS